MRIMIRDYPHSKRPFWSLLGRELLAYTGAGLLYPTGMTSSKRRTPRQTDQRTVVLVHGYMSNRSALLPLALYLRTHGIRVLAFNYNSGGGIEQGAIQLKNYLRRHVRGGRIDLVCHSVGGLVARSYIQELGGARRVDRCITLGTPHLGTYNAYWLPSRIGRELMPDSSLLQRLEASRTKAAKVRFTAIVAGSDTIVIPRIFSAHEQSVHMPDLGHISMLFSLSTFRVVVDCLKDRQVAGQQASVPDPGTVPETGPVARAL